MARELILAGATTTLLLGACLSLPVLAQSRGELLYSTHCIACHTEQVHWRERKLVTDWASLRAQVWRWQADAALGWNDDDVAEVARYLNEEFYRLPSATVPAGLGGFASRREGPGRREMPLGESLVPSPASKAGQ